MPPLPTYNYPWDLIVNSFSGNLSKDDEAQLQQWMSSNSLNGERYRQLQEIWENGLDDYKFYLMADETKAWNTLQAKLTNQKGENVTNLFSGNKRRLIYRIASIAAALLILIGGGVWYALIQNVSPIYETAYNEHKKINLADGSSILLQPQTKIQVSHDYNENERTVKLISGEAFFGIMHQNGKPFIVDMGVSNVEDIGTNFTIKKWKELIKVSVINGKVAFIKNATKETRELTAGMSLVFNIQNESFGEIVYDTSGIKNLLEFDNTPLSDVIVLLQKVYGVKIQITDKDIMRKKLTAHLNGVPYITAIKVICRSLNLEYSVKDNVCRLKEKSRAK